MANRGTVASASSKLFLLSLLSPLAGILVEISLANTFGSTALIDAYRISFLLLMFGTQLFFGQLVTGVLVPLIADYSSRGKEQEGWQVAFSMAAAIVLITLPGVIFVVAKPEILQQLLGPGLGGEAALQAQLMLRFFAVIFVIYIWTGVINGLLHSYHVFWVQPVGQLMANVILVCLIILAGRNMQEWVFILGFGLASILSILFYVISIRNVAIRHSISLPACFYFKFSLIPYDVLKLAIPIIILIFATQWSTLVINRSLTDLSVGAVADYGYALKLQMLGSLLPLTLAIILFPRLASAASGKNIVTVAHLASRGIQWMLFISVPAAVIIFFVREPLVEMFYQHGEMSKAGIDRVSNFLGILSFVVPVAALNDLLFRVSYSMKNSLAPLGGQLIVAAGVTFLASIASSYTQEYGVIAAYVSLTWLAVIFLIVYLQHNYQLWHLRNSMRYLWCLVIAITMAAFVMEGCLLLVSMLGAHGFIGDILHVGVVTLSGIVTYLIIAGLLKMQEVSELVKWVLPLCQKTMRR
ncbi:MAG: hypothetical protein GXP14_02580 [Gammaproteobacteria bacterium]|nr:hypothetical protein [Gammaproteobacteria bacterium]